MKSGDFRRELAAILNCCCKDNGSDNPDWLLADYLIGCLENYDKAVRARDKHFGEEKKRDRGPQ